MSEVSSRSIQTVKKVNAKVSVPPSKSYTNRALIVASLADGVSVLSNISESEDSIYLTSALREFGIDIKKEANVLNVQGVNGKPNAPDKDIFIGNAGTAIRFLTTFSSLANGNTVLTGDEAMQKRPIKDLLDALTMAGIKTSSTNGCPPVTIYGGNFKGGKISLNGTVSSQFVSSILLSAPYAKYPIELHINGKMSSTPYVDMSIHVMRSFGAEIQTIVPYSFYLISNKDQYIAEPFRIEGDASSASYFFAAAAITGGKVIVSNLSQDSLQGDMKFLYVLEDMGCRITKHSDSIEIHGGTLHGIDIDMNEIPDCVPAIAIVAAFAEGETKITNVAHLRYKETDRLTAIATQLTNIGGKVRINKDGLTIYPQKLHGATIETYNDHRIAMSFAVAGLRIPGIEILNPACVKKSFPNFWEEFKLLEESKQ